MQPRDAIRAATIACTLLVTCTLADSARAQGQLGAARLPGRAMLARYGLERYWWNQATLNPSRDKLVYLVADEQLLYAQASSAVLTTFDAESGKRLWSRQIGRIDQPGYPVFSNRELVLAAYGTRLFALNKFNGDILWSIKMPGQPATTPAVDEKHVYIGTLDGSVYAFSLAKIRELFELARLPQWSYQTVAWRYKTAREVTTPPVPDGNYVYFSSRGGSLYSVTTEKRELQFQLETDAPISAPMADSDSALYMASEDFNFYCINKLDGQVRWDFTAGLPIRQRPWLITDRILLAPFTGGLHCLKAASGEPVWWRPEVNEFLGATRNLMFGSDDLGNVLVLSRETGVPVGSLPLRNFSVRFQNDRTDRLYLATSTGTVIAIRDRLQEFPLYHRHPDRRPILPEFVPEGGLPAEDTGDDSSDNG